MIMRAQPILIDIFRPQRSEMIGASGSEAIDPIEYMAWRRPIFAPTG